MKPFTQKRMQLTAIMMVLLCLTQTAFAQQEEKAAQMLHYLMQHRFDSAHAMLNEDAREAMSAVRLGLAWTGLERENGAVDSIGKPEAEWFQDQITYFQYCRFTKTAFELVLTFDSNGVANMMRIIPSRPKARYTKPSYAPDASRYTERKMILQNGRYKMNAILTMPASRKKVPVVILVHGSGPNDMDETTGNSKLFKDLALGLAAEGVATFRYDKRTKAYGGKSVEDIELLTLDEEVILDVLKAVELMYVTEGINQKEIYVLGHSLGGMCAPRIASRSKKIKGIVMMAANARPLHVVVEEQLQYLFTLDDTLSKEEEESIQEYRLSVKRLSDSTALALASPDELPLSLPTAYWIDLLRYDQVKTATQLKQPILVLQGARDYQVTMKEFNIWENQLGKGRQQAQFNIYPKLNHLFMEGEGRCTPKEYEAIANTPLYVIQDIAGWIKEKK